MPVRSLTLDIHTRGFTDIVDLTTKARDLLAGSSILNGVMTLFVPGSTAGLTTIEYERGAIADLKRAIERIAPQEIPYEHDARWGDGNGFAHVRAALLGPSVSVPFTGGELALGTWQQIILIDFDNRERQRSIRVQIMGE